MGELDMENIEIQKILDFIVKSLRIVKIKQLNDPMENEQSDDQPRNDCMIPTPLYDNSNPMSRLTMQMGTRQSISR